MRGTLLDILIGFAAGVGAIVFVFFFLVLMLRYDRPVPRPVPEDHLLFARLDAIHLMKTCPDNSWYEYLLDFKTLGDVTSDYVGLIHQKPEIDKSEYLLQNLRASLEDLAKRNEAGARSFDRTTFHSHDLPVNFGIILNQIETEKRTGVSVSDERALQTAIQNWYTDAGFPPANTISSTISGWCAFN